MNNQLLIRNCRLYNKLDISVNILVSKGIITAIGDIDVINKNCKIIDACNKIAAPGFIDLHIQGAGGSDVLDGSREAIQKISSTLAKFGTTSFLATTVMKPKEMNKHLKIAAELTNAEMEGANLLGIHIEGPFINPVKKGGIDPASIYNSTAKRMDEILKITNGNLKMMTIAPELKGNIEIIERLLQNNVVASFGHSDAEYSIAKECFEIGVKHVTHLFNAMRPLHHREPGPIAAIFENNLVTTQIISDGHHIHPSIVNLIYRNIGASRCVCITDGVQAMGLPEGNYKYNGKDYISKNGAARYKDGTLIGSTMPLNKIAFSFMKFTGCSFEEAVETVSLNPARVINTHHRKGTLEPGKDADIVLIDKEFNVYSTIINGKLIN